MLKAKPINDVLSGLYLELRLEVDKLAGSQASEGQTIYPDPATLTQLERRLLVRSIFSFIEGMSFAIKAESLNFRGATTLSDGEVQLAKEESYELDPSGIVKLRSAKLQTLANVRFAFNIFAKCARLDWSLDVSSNGWEQLRRSFQVRNRLTHPKRCEDLVVADTEVRDCLSAFSWFDAQFIDAMASTIATLEKELRSVLARKLDRRKEPQTSHSSGHS
jgi:hypothetical protein